MTRLTRRAPDGRYRSRRCWEAVLDTLGLPSPDGWALGPDPYGPEFMRHVRTAYRTTRVVTPTDRLTFTEFRRRYRTGTYIVASTDHVAVLVDFTWTDTEPFGRTNRRVRFADRLTPRDPR